MKLNIYLLINAILIISFKTMAQPCTETEEYLRKRHRIEGMNYGHPYTTFDRHNGLTFQETIENIRKTIKKENDPDNEGPIYTAYKLLYIFASKPMPTDNGMHNESPSELALWAKNNAFVMLIGLDGNADTLSLAERAEFKYKALQAFSNLNGEIGNFPLLNKKLDKHKFYSRSLISWLQAYDLLKASAAIPQLSSIKWENNFDSDANNGKCHPRNKLRKLTRDLYLNSKGSFGIVEHKWGWKKNHGIAAASALLMAAQVLNDAGVETSYAYELKSIKI